jgi:hypothetical protein
VTLSGTVNDATQGIGEYHRLSDTGVPSLLNRNSG